MLRSRGRARTLPWIAAVAALAALPTFGCASSRSPRQQPPETQVEGKNEPTHDQRVAHMHYELGVEHLSAGRTPQAISELLESARINPNDEQTQLALAEAYRRSGRMLEAEQHLLRALQLKPDFQQAHLNISALYIQLERYQDAIPHAQHLIDDPTFPFPWRALTNLGWAEFQIGRLDPAAQHLAMALDYKPDYWPARLNLGILEAQRSNRAEAVRQFERVLEAQPGPLAEAEVRYRLAEIRIAMGDRAAAIDQLTKATDLHPSGPWGKRSAEYLKSLQ
ncbi:MAG TPA: tetratricopeptide repeat protein [Myxococcota bacterium]|nr:tetratricopeptide repeat protein [Myxococcota bacterium]